MSTENQNTTSVVTKTPSHSERFTLAVEREFASSAGKIELTSFQRKLIQNYFIKLDQVLKEAERKRLSKNEQNRDITPVTWENVNMQKLSVDVIAFSSIGLDPCQNNHLSLIPFKNNATGKYDINLMIGYVGLELKAKKYGYDVPLNIVTEVVYSTDKFKQFKKDMNNKTETYSFETTSDFDRGEIIGGFFYKEYENPEKNVLKVFSKKDIEKRKPKYASVEFWGGSKKKYGSNELEEVEGWEDEMALKTIKRAAYNSIPIDSSKIDEHLMKIIESENDYVKEVVQQEIQSNSNQESIGFENIAHDIEAVEVNDPEPVLNVQPKDAFEEPDQNNKQMTAPF